MSTKRRFQLNELEGFVSGAQTESARFEVKMASAHLRCLARPGGDHDNDITELGDISSPAEKVRKVNGSWLLTSLSLKRLTRR